MIFRQSFDDWNIWNSRTVAITCFSIRLVGLCRWLACVFQCAETERINRTGRARLRSTLPTTTCVHNLSPPPLHLRMNPILSRLLQPPPPFPSFFLSSWIAFFATALCQSLTSHSSHARAANYGDFDFFQSGNADVAEREKRTQMHRI